jgi:hypothetical protein
LLFLQRVLEVIEIGIVELTQLCVQSNSLPVIVSELLQLLALLSHTGELGVFFELLADGSRLLMILFDDILVD